MRIQILLIGLITLLAGCGCEEKSQGPVLPGELPTRNYGIPAWGPGDVILFGHTPANIDSSGLWRINADGTGKSFFLPTYFDHPDWSPDGQWLALDKDAQIYKVTVTKDSVVQLTSGSLRKFHSSWSPDGKWITFSINDGDYSDWGIWMVSADGAELRHIRQTAGINPDWSPLGDKITFPGWPDETQKQKLMLMDANGANLHVLFDPNDFGFDYGVDHPSFSPDGKKIIFQTNQTETKDAQIWVVNTDGSKPKRLTSKGGLEPSWSPDGRQIVYVRFSYRHPEQTGNGKLWMMDGDGKNKRQFTF